MKFNRFGNSVQTNSQKLGCFSRHFGVYTLESELALMKLPHIRPESDGTLERVLGGKNPHKIKVTIHIQISKMVQFRLGFIQTGHPNPTNKWMKPASTT